MTRVVGAKPASKASAPGLNPRRWFVLFNFLFLAGASHAQEPNELLGRWLDAQGSLSSWTADLVQTRYLQALTQPLVTPGKVWFVAPAQFRWELGQPPQSIALRAGDQLLVLSPRLKRAERYPLSGITAGPMKDALALLDSGFPRDAADFRRRFELLSLTETNGTYHFQLQPRAPSARKFLPSLTLEVATNGLQLMATELRFVDGSRMRNDFSHAVQNPAIDAAVFDPGLDASWKITEPAGKL